MLRLRFDNKPVIEGVGYREQPKPKVETKVVKTESGLYCPAPPQAYSHISDMLPSLYVDFDGKELTSYYPEPASYKLYVPIGWLGKYEQFLENVPEDYRYWVIHGENLF